MGKKLDVDGWTINDVMDSYTKNELFVDQRYQRKLVWSLDDKILFIDSLMKAFPIPNIMMAEYNGREGNTTYGIIDGLQRINSIISFMLGEFPISINGKTGYFDIKCATGTLDLYQEGKLSQRKPVLDRQICKEFRGYKLPIISTSHDAIIIDEIFKRLNSTGTKLSKHDLRQAGALNKFSQLVREISSTIRGGKTLHDIVTLEIMPEISLSNKGLDYGINIENVFWRRHGILTEDLLRKSRDEEIIAILLGAFLLDRPTSVISSSILDNLYDEKTENGKIADKKLQECFDNLKTLFIQVFNEIDLICDEAKTNISNMLFTDDRRKTDMFMVFFVTMLQVYFESKAIGDYKGFTDTVSNAKQLILGKLEEKKTVDYIAEINTVKLFTDLIASYLVNVETESKVARDVISRLNLSSTETRYTEYKIGLTYFNTPTRYRHNEGKINYRNISQMAKVATAMANIKRNPDSLGMIIVGVADNEKDYNDWSNHYKRNAYKYNSHRVVGIDAEADVHYKSVDCMMNAFKARIDKEPISNELKENLKSYEIVTIQKRSLIVITITAQSGQLYDGKKYIREGSDLKEVKN
ncbi:DUF262 domain-containing protein [Lachnospiraceae bacterium]|nr:DUF262 domain-containing protein [uncultured Schaedlerella sp.]EOS40016.1 hypothetical protein C808_00987 [Lachnospiraceae bacterium M18-1]NBI57824.1 DUF262 domain-containing protein [Lachnospiraceae bacterium]